MDWCLAIIIGCCARCGWSTTGWKSPPRATLSSWRSPIPVKRFGLRFLRSGRWVRTNGRTAASCGSGMGVHTGSPRVRDRNYWGIDVHYAARLCAAANGGQVLVSESTAGLVDVALEDLGEHALRDFPAARRIFHLPIDERGKDFFPAPRTLQTGQTNLPDQLSSFVGRAADLARLRALAARERLVTLTGPGGVGKTRLALRLGAELLDGGGDGVWFVDLAPLSDGALVVFRTAEVLGVTARAGQEVLDALGERLSTRRLVVVLDNCEHVIEAAREPGRESCSRVVRACSCWRPVASRLGSLASMLSGAYAVGSVGGGRRARCAGGLRSGAAVRYAGGATASRVRPRR